MGALRNSYRTQDQPRSFIREYDRAYRGNAKLSPRVRQAIYLYGTATCPTLKEACEVVGFSHALASDYLNYNPEAQELLSEAQALIADRTIATSTILEKLSRKALGKMGDLLDHDRPDVQLKAAMDLLDRGPQTSKVQRHQIESWAVTDEQAAAIVAAMTEATLARETFGAEVSQGSYEKLPPSPSEDGSK